MSNPDFTDLAVRLMRLEISQKRVIELLRDYDIERIERQLYYLPYRKARRPGAFLIDAIRHDYSAPKDLFHAPFETQSKAPDRSLDQGAEHPDGPPPPGP